MAKVGIMHSGSQGTDDDNVKAFQKSLELGYGGAVDYAGSPLYAKELGKHLRILPRICLPRTSIYLSQRAAPDLQKRRGMKEPRGILPTSRSFFLRASRAIYVIILRRT